MSFQYRCSTAQRENVARLMRKLELDPLVVTLMTLRYFDAAKLPRPFDGTSVYDAVRELTVGQCSALIDAMKKEVDE